MKFVRITVDEQPYTVYEFAVLSSWFQRLRGLLATTEQAHPVLLTKCRSIHSYGMRYALDVAFVGEQGEVLLVKRHFAPRQFLSCKQAICVLERPARQKAWFKTGDHVWVVSMSL